MISIPKSVKTQRVARLYIVLITMPDYTDTKSTRPSLLWFTMAISYAIPRLLSDAPSTRCCRRLENAKNANPLIIASSIRDSRELEYNEKQLRYSLTTLALTSR